MAASLPTSIKDFAAFLELDLAKIIIHCHFCKKRLTLEDKLSFDVRHHKLIYDGAIPYGACTPCVRRAARKEFDEGLMIPMKLHEVVAYEGKPLTDVVILCVKCLKEMDMIEKTAFAKADFFCCMVKEHCYRGMCRCCMQPEGRE